MLPIIRWFYFTNVRTRAPTASRYSVPNIR